MSKARWAIRLVIWSVAATCTVGVAQHIHDAASASQFGRISLLSFCILLMLSDYLSRQYFPRQERDRRWMTDRDLDRKYGFTRMLIGVVTCGSVYLTLLSGFYGVIEFIKQLARHAAASRPPPVIFGYSVFLVVGMGMGASMLFALSTVADYRKRGGNVTRTDVALNVAYCALWFFVSIRLFST